MAKRIALGIDLVPGAWGNDYDTENLFQERPLLEDMEDQFSGNPRDIQPKKTLRNHQYNGPTEPLIIRPEYTGDFLDKLREQYKNKTADSLTDFSNPEELLKYLPDVVPRDLTDEFYEMNSPGPGAGGDDLKEYPGFGWDEEDSPEMSEDKILRMRKQKNYPCLNPVKPENAKRVINSFIKRQDLFHAHSVVAKYLMVLDPREFEIDQQQVRVAKILSDFDTSLIYTKTKGWRKPNLAEVTVRLVRAEPRMGRWTFMTSSGGPSYSTIFQFIPQGNLTDPNKLQVRCSCSCPSWVFWGAQWNAYRNNYLYGKAVLKLIPPNKRDPTGRFFVCKHVLACIPVVSKYKVAPMPGSVKKRIQRPPRLEIDKSVPEEKLHIPQDLKSFGKQKEIKEVVEKWLRMSDRDRENFINGLDAPGAVAFFAHRFPATAAIPAAEKLKDMAKNHRIPQFRVLAKKFLRDFPVQ
jgi:hypothetical protein